LSWIFRGFLGSFWQIFAYKRFLAIADFWHSLVYFIAHLVSFTDMQGQSIAKMLLNALYRLKFGLSY
jgi:hypothetical protein